MAAFSESFINTALHRLPWADKALGGPLSSLPFPIHRRGKERDICGGVGRVSSLGSDVGSPRGKLMPLSPPSGPIILPS